MSFGSRRPITLNLTLPEEKGSSPETPTGASETRKRGKPLIDRTGKLWPTFNDVTEEPGRPNAYQFLGGVRPPRKKE